MKWGWVGAAIFLILALVACVEGEEVAVVNTAVPTPRPTIEPTVTKTAVPALAGYAVGFHSSISAANASACKSAWFRYRFMMRHAPM